jgi:hypothetical protein
MARRRDRHLRSSNRYLVADHLDRAALDNACIEVPYEAALAARTVLDRCSRTEDVRFSPNNRRLAFADLERDLIVVVDVDVDTVEGRPRVGLLGAVECSAPCLDGPHNVEFLGDDTIVVTSRYGGANVLQWRSAVGPVEGMTLREVGPPPRRGFELLGNPSGIACLARDHRTIEVLICNHTAHTLTRHTLDRDSFAVSDNKVLLRRWLKVPDGVTASADGRWIAVSNHDRRVVMLYDRALLHEDAEPVAILRGAVYPHGLRFSADARHLFVADAGSPYVHLFSSGVPGWRGAQYPSASIPVVGDALLAAARDRYPYAGDWGPKGIDVDKTGRVLAVTSALQPLAFLDIAAVVGAGARPDGRCDDARRRYETAVLDDLEKADGRLAALRSSKSFRITAPLRRFSDVWATTRAKALLQRVAASARVRAK